MIIPLINTTGYFTFSSPLDAMINSAVPYKVAAVRSIPELAQNGEDPDVNIYDKYGISTAQFKQDVLNNIPIVVLTTDGCTYTYVPANKIESAPTLNGVGYQEQIIASKLGALPVDYDFSLLKTTVVDAIYSVTGINTTAELVPASSITVKTVAEHEAYMALLASRITLNKSCQQRYQEALSEIALLKSKINAIITCLETDCCH